MNIKFLFFFVFIPFTLGFAQTVDSLKPIIYYCTIDSTYQPAMFAKVNSIDAKPLLVGLHTWGSDYTSEPGKTYYNLAKSKGWNYIFPNLRGPNNNPKSTGSEYVIKDAEDAVRYAISHSNVDLHKIYLIGASGGGYTALLLASRLPDIWAGVSAWVPITDLMQWLKETEVNGYPNFRNDIINSLGGDPRVVTAALLQCIQRSPVTHLHNALNIPIDLNTGINDGHTGSVNVSHSLNAYNILANPVDTISHLDIKFISDSAKIPVYLKWDSVDVDYYSNPVLLRKYSNNVRLTIFNGGHLIIYTAGVNWLSKQYKALVDVKNDLPEIKFSLSQNYPNPFNPTTTIKYSISKSGFVRLKIYDILGEEVSTLVNEELQVGDYETMFDGKNLSSGMYFYKLQAGDIIKIKKMLLVK